MAGRASAKRTPEWQEMLKRSLLRSGELIGSILLFLTALFLTLALLSYHPTDPSMNTVAGGSIANMMGAPRVWIPDILIWIFGLPGALVLSLLFVFSRRIWVFFPLFGWRGPRGLCFLVLLLLVLSLFLYHPS